MTVDVYEDLGCRYCHEFQADVFPDLEDSYLETGGITYRHFDFPVEAADESVAMANAARAVQAETGTDDDSNGQFFEYKSAVMEHDDWNDEALAELAEPVGVDPASVSSALADDTYYPTLAADWERGAEGASNARRRSSSTARSSTNRSSSTNCGRDRRRILTVLVTIRY